MKTPKNDKDLAASFLELVDLAATLRSPEGCPWDRKQTIETVKIYLLEECYEAMDAIEKKDYPEMCSELGDLLFMIVFLTQLSGEQSLFSMFDVINSIVNKMKRRHPHVFGDTVVSSSEDVSDNWQKIKMKEENNKDKSASSILEDVPSCLPALLRSHRLSKKASKTGFDWKNRDDIWDKVKEEFSELSDAVNQGKEEDIKEEIGDLFFSLVNLARHWKFNSEELLRDANYKFTDRFKKMESHLNESGIKLEDATYEEMNSAWDSIKKNRV